MTSRRDFIKGLTAALVAASVQAVVAESFAEKTAVSDNLWHHYNVHIVDGKIKQIFIDNIDSAKWAPVLPKVEGQEEATISYWAKFDPDYEQVLVDDLLVQGNFKNLDLLFENSNILGVTLFGMKS